MLQETGLITLALGRTGILEHAVISPFCVYFLIPIFCIVGIGYHVVHPRIAITDQTADSLGNLMLWYPTFIVFNLVILLPDPLSYGQHVTVC